MSKGTRNERYARKNYESAGCWTYSPQNSMYGDNDLWNLFDIASILIGVQQPHIYLTQVKTNRASGIRQWFNDTRPFQRVDGVTVHYAVRIDNEGWKLARSASDGYEWVVDERSMSCKMGEGVVQYLKNRRRES